MPSVEAQAVAHALLLVVAAAGQQRPSTGTNRLSALARSRAVVATSRPPRQRRVAAIVEWLDVAASTGDGGGSGLDGEDSHRARARGLLFYRLLQYAAGAPPLTDRQLVADPQPKAIKPAGVKGPRSRPGSLAQPPEDRPWRATTALD